MTAMVSAIDGPAWAKVLIVELRAALPACETRRLLVTAIAGAKSAGNALFRVREAMAGRELSVQERHEYTVLLAALSAQEEREKELAG